MQIPASASGTDTRSDPAPDGLRRIGSRGIEANPCLRRACMHKVEKSLKKQQAFQYPKSRPNHGAVKRARVQVLRHDRFGSFAKID
jgi:hypothetical protein